MLPKKQLEQLADVRANEAKTLFNAGLFSGAYYLAGYALEFALKARIAKNFQADAIPEKSYVQDIFTHDLKKLMGLAALKRNWIRECRAISNSRHSGESRASGTNRQGTMFGTRSRRRRCWLRSATLRRDCSNGSSSTGRAAADGRPSTHRADGSRRCQPAMTMCSPSGRCNRYGFGMFFIASAARMPISSGGTSSWWVAMAHRLPHLSERTP